MKVVLLPGLDGTGDLFQPFLDAAPPDIECVVVRYPPDRVLGYSELAELVDLPSGDIVLVAESFSGPIAAKLAARQNVRHVVLVNSFVRPPHPSFLRWFAWPLLFRFLPPQWCLGAFKRETLKKVKPEVMAARLKFVLTVDELESLRAANKPILYLRGTRDWLVWNRSARQIPFAKIVSIKAPHALLQVAPVEAWRAIESIVRDSRPV